MNRKLKRAAGIIGLGTILGLMLANMVILFVNVQYYREFRKDDQKQDIILEIQGGADVSSESTERETVTIVLDDPRRACLLNYENIGVIVNVKSFLNIRSKPDVNSTIVGKAPKLSVFDILEETNGWYKISSEGNIGYVSADYVTTGEAAEIYAMENCTEHVQPRETTYVYRQPDTTSQVLMTLFPSDDAYVMDDIGKFVKVSLPGVTGYMLSEGMDKVFYVNSPFFFGDIANLSDERIQLVNYAFEFYGGKYVWGGVDLGEGVDCSGYTMRIFEHFHHPMPRLSVEQSVWGEEVPTMDEMKPGDLLFFHGYRNGVATPGVGHVAIYIGGGKMIHAASEARGIVMDDVTVMGEILAMRRIIKD